MDFDLYARFVLALAFVLVLFAVMALVMRRLGMGMGGRGGSRLRRLAVVDALALDPKRRLVLIRRDGTEHLLLLSASGDVVVEAGIRAPETFGDAMKALPPTPAPPKTPPAPPPATGAGS